MSTLPTQVRLALSAATPLAVIAATGLVWQGSHAAFTGATRNSGNSWTSASLTLTDDDAGSARFNATNLTPGQTETRCIRVTANTTVGGTVRGYFINPVTSAQRLEDRVKLTIRSGNGGDFASCAGFTPIATLIPDVALSTLMTYDSYAEGMDSWTVTPGTQHRTYQLTWRFDTTGMSQAQIDQLQGARTGADIQLEMRTP